MQIDRDPGYRNMITMGDGGLPWPLVTIHRHKAARRPFAGQTRPAFFRVIAEAVTEGGEPMVAEFGTWREAKAAALSAFDANARVVRRLYGVR